MLTVQLEQADSGGSRTVAVGEAVVVALPENPTTGYRWQVDADASLVRLVTDDFEAASQLRGAGGVRVLTFKALEPGQLRLTLDRRREWESPQSPASAQFWLDLTITR